MRLKQIKLIGFKSFVDPTVLHLNSQIIGIVGPNGCGKSNIIDAVRWVLGESSAKDLRGESMLDVIFNGSSMRKPIGRAAIELLFDNLEGKLNREYANFSEVAIRREIDRERQSEYFLNNKRCRKRDITDLFAGTGLLHNGYAIVGQGTVGKIIESKPEELRSYIEEAADISIYKKRKHETQLRMNHTEENLSRLQDLVSEQARLLEKLEKQSIVAEKYQNYQADKQQIEIQLLKVKVYQFKQDLALYNQKITEYALQLEQKKHR
jgi:chromosome segregation protein